MEENSGEVKFGKMIEMVLCERKLLGLKGGMKLKVSMVMANKGHNDQRI